LIDDLTIGVGQNEYGIGKAYLIFFGKFETLALVDIHGKKHHGLKGLDQGRIGFRFTSGFLAEFSVLVDKLHQDWLARLSR
jgi:hypothetical protein